MMSNVMVDSLMDFFKREKEGISVSKTPKGFCPNCWGQQEYGDLVREMYADKQIDVNNHDAHYAFIQDFVISRVQGIHLKKGDNSFDCPTCHKKYPL